MAQLLRVQNFTVSRDGFGAGENQSFERPFGHADPGDMFAWAGATASWPNRTHPGGSRGLDDYFTRDFANNIGAEIMGRNTFGPQRGPWRDHEWQGWWGNEPPFHTAVFVMTHHERPSFTLSDTTFHFVSGDPATILERAREAAQGKDVRLGGGATSSDSSSRRTSSTPSMWQSPRGWRSAPDRAWGSHLRSCSTGSTMRLCRAPAA